MLSPARRARVFHALLRMALKQMFAFSSKDLEALVMTTVHKCKWTPDATVFRWNAKNSYRIGAALDCPLDLLVKSVFDTIQRHRLKSRRYSEMGQRLRGLSW